MVVDPRRSLYSRASQLAAFANIYSVFEFKIQSRPFKYIERQGIIDHEVKFNITFRPVTQCYTLSAGSISPSTPALTSASLYVDYIYLDTDERRQFAQVQHKILCVAKQSLKGFVSAQGNFVAFVSLTNEQKLSMFLGAILINCGDILTIFTTILYNYKRTRLKIVPKGKNVNILNNPQGSHMRYCIRYYIIFYQLILFYIVFYAIFLWNLQRLHINRFLYNKNLKYSLVPIKFYKNIQCHSIKNFDMNVLRIFKYI